VYLPTNAAAAAVWTLGIGLGAFYIGPAIVDFVGDLGWITGGGLVVLVLITIGAEITRRRRRRGRSERVREADDPD
jgi:membrane protein DedA with SNARE-associated domain